MSNRRAAGLLGIFGVVVLLIVSSTAPAQAAFEQFASFRTGVFNQTSNAQPTTPAFYFYNARGFVDSPSDFNSMTLTYPGTGSPAGLAFVSPNFFSTNLASVSTLAALNAAFPLGAYTLTGTPTNGTSTSTIQYTQDAYSGSVPFLTGSTFTNLQGLNVRQAFTFNLTPFITGTIANESDIFFSITNVATTQTVFSQSFLPSTTSSIVLPASTLLPNTQYEFLLDYSNRINNFGVAPSTVQGFDLETQGLFTTGSTVPEPASLTMGASAALIGLGVCWCRRRVVS